jgi:hypothetical protein
MCVIAKSTRLRSQKYKKLANSALRSHVRHTIGIGLARRWLRDRSCSRRKVWEIIVAQTYPIDIAREIDRRWERLFRAATPRAANSGDWRPVCREDFCVGRLAGEDSGDGLVRGVTGRAGLAVASGA